MKQALVDDGDWLRPPIVNRHTRLVAVMKPGVGRLWLEGWERLLARSRPVESMTAVLADLGRPVVGLVEPERELSSARAELQALSPSTGKGRSSALVP